MPETFDADASRITLFTAALDAMKQHGKSKIILEDADGQALTYGRLILASFVLGRRLAGESDKGEVVGVLLPNVAGLMALLLGLNAFGRVAAMLNFTAGPRSVTSAIETARIRTVITSRRFVEVGKLAHLIEAIGATRAGDTHVRIIYLEDLRRTIGLADKVKGVFSSLFARRVHAQAAMRPDSAAVILFTSGTEGLPKGVVLSNRNLVANAQQIAAHARGFLTSRDIVLNPLPMFHSFGLTAAGLMPLLSGMKAKLYPSPLHYKQVPKAVADSKATLLFATDTFLQGYMRAADPGDLASVRFVVAGAERVKDHTRAAWSSIGAVVLEGYGATECAPVLACNLPDSNTPGSVGPLLPGIESRLETVPGLDGGGRLLVRGPNVMAGYLLADNPGAIVSPPGGWHDTGDIVEIDANGLVFIRGRAKRFAKIGGEMVSLAAVEDVVAAVWPECNHAVVNVSDPRRGEQLVLITEYASATRDRLLAAARSQGVPELWVPRQIVVVDQLPLLGTGKIDLPAASALARTATSTRD